MKVKSERSQEKRPLKKESFLKVLKAPPAKAPMSAPISSTRAEKLASVRSAMHVEAHRLVNRRDESHVAHDENQNQRLSELIANEIGRGILSETSPSSRTSSAPQTISMQGLSSESVARALPHSSDKSTAIESKPSARVDSIVAMAEKIEWLVRQTRPALSLTLSGTQGGIVDIEKISARKVRIRLNRGDVLSPQALSQLQNELKAKGLSWVMDESGPRIGVKQ